MGCGDSNAQALADNPLTVWYWLLMRFNDASSHVMAIVCLVAAVVAGCKPNEVAMSELDDEPKHTEIPVDPAVTKDLFREWRSPRFGNANPQRMNNLVWEWLIKTRLNADADCC
jgi:hypothetical protein